MRGPLAIAIAIILLELASTATVTAQTAPPDTTAPATALPPTAPLTAPPAPADTASIPPISRARAARAALGRDSDRFELGAAVVDGPFDVIGTLGYERYVRRGGPFEDWVHVEVTGGSTKYLNEGTASAGYFLRPLRTIRREWRLRPILEFGAAGHLVVQVAEIQGFSGQTAFHAHAYLKTHAIAGLETVFGTHWGLVARGRLSVPAHHPFDYAQIALFFR